MYLYSNNTSTEHIFIRKESVMDYVMLLGGVVGISTVLAAIIIAALALTKLDKDNILKN